MTLGPLNPTDDLSSCDTEECDLGDCHEKWAWETTRRNGPRLLRLCEGHADRWLQGEREFYAELEEMAGRVPPRRPAPGSAAALTTIGRGEDKRRQARRAV